MFWTKVYPTAGICNFCIAWLQDRRFTRALSGLNRRVREDTGSTWSTPMSASKNESPEDFAVRAHEVLEQAYGYYTQLPRVAEVKPSSETYYEYVKAA